MESAAVGQDRLTLPPAARVVRLIVLLELAAFAISTVPGVRGEPGFDPLLDGWLQGSAYVAAAVLAVLRAIAWRPDRTVWAWIAGALSLRAAGFVVYLSYVRTLQPPPYPSIADVAWLGMAVVLLIGLVLLARAHSAGVATTVWLDGLVGAFAAAAIGLTLLEDTLEQLTAKGIPSDVVATNLAYPATDLALLIVIIAVLVGFDWRPPPAVWLLGAGVAGFAIVDTVFLVKVTENTYRPGTPLAALSLAATALIALSGWLRPGVVTKRRLEPLPGLILPVLFALACLGLLIYAAYGDVPAGAIWLGAAGLLTATVSAVLTVRALRRERATVQAAGEAADRANRAKDEFLSRMSHELRTPLNAILGFGQLLELSDLPPDRRENVEQITRAGRHLLGLINEVLDLSRIESGQVELAMEPVSVGRLVDDVISLTSPLSGARRVRVTAAVGGGACVRADRRRLEQTLLNLLANAVKFSPEGSDVVVRARRAGERWRIEVADHGPGIPAAKLERVFVPFDRLGAERSGIEGSGLGLALTKSLVEIMDGEIGVESEEGEGSVFWIELAAAQPDDEPATTAARDDAGPPATPDDRPTVLYIEDNEANRFLVERILDQRPGIHLVTATTGAGGVRVATERRPDLILLDLHLDDMAGEDVLLRLRGDASTAEIAVVVLSADASGDRIERMLAAGAADYLTKPFEVPELLGLVDRLTAASRARR